MMFTIHAEMYKRFPPCKKIQLRSSFNKSGELLHVVDVLFTVAHFSRLKMTRKKKGEFQIFCTKMEPLETDVAIFKTQPEVRGRFGFECQLAGRHNEEKMRVEHKAPMILSQTKITSPFLGWAPKRGLTQDVPP